MASIQSLMVATSGLVAAQAGLYVTGHNISNTETTGYVRQQVLQNDFYSRLIGVNRVSSMQVGLGTDVSAIRQIRDKFLDISYREQSCKQSFYNVKYAAGVEIEEILGEMEGEYRLEKVLSDLWDAISELHIDPTGLETRGMFVTTAKSFVDKVNNIYQRLYEYQRNLNDQVKASVTDINNLLIKIDKLNGEIALAEAAGDNANDYRDTRNNCLDELSRILPIDYKERANGVVDIMCEGNELLVGGVRQTVGLRYTSNSWDFVEPVFTTSTEILGYDPQNKYSRPLFRFNSDVSAENGNDTGSLKGMLISRGLSPANYTMSPGQLTPGTPEYFNITNCLIPRMQMEIDTLVNSIVTMINDTFAPYIEVEDPPGTFKKVQDPNAPVGLDGTQHLEIFVRKAPAYASRYDADGNLIEEDRNQAYSLYSIGNIQINPLLLSSSGYDKIAISKQGDVSDNRTVLNELMKKWRSNFIGIDNDEKTNVEGFYRRIVDRNSIATNEAKNYVKTQEDLVNEIDNKRKRISGVSMDEEMQNMIIYQHAYNASARVVNVIDSMLDKLINGTGRVGL